MRRFLATAAALVVACDLVVIAVHTFTEEPGSQQGALVRDPNQERVVPAPGQAVVQGTLETLAADAEGTDLLPAPLTIHVPVRGAGNAVIRQAGVNGQRATIVWDSGRPLVIASRSGEGGLDPGPVHVEVDASGERWSLDGAVRSFVAGRYNIATPVAVGAGGLATPVDSVEFDADTGTTLVTTGNAFVHRDRRALRLVGPGNVSARGSFTVTTAEGPRQSDVLLFGTGPFVLELTPDGATYRVAATFQGPLRSVARQ